MSRLTDLIAQAKAKDPQLGADLEREFSKQLSTRGGDKPHHTVINGENYDVLKALTYP